jgi:hypothetical protein
VTSDLAPQIKSAHDKPLAHARVSVFENSNRIAQLVAAAFCGISLNFNISLVRYLDIDSLISKDLRNNQLP